MIEESLIEIDQKKELENAIAKSQILLSYASQEGKSLDANIVTPLVMARNELNDGNGLSQEEAFWVAYAKLSKLVEPVTVTSLQAVREKNEFYSIWSNVLSYLFKSKYERKGKSMARKTVSSYRKNFLIGMIVMIIIQVYWVIGVSLVDDAKTTTKNIVSLNREKDILSDRMELVDDDDTLYIALDTTRTRVEQEHQRFLERQTIVADMLFQWNRSWNWPLDYFSKRGENEVTEDYAQRMELQASFAITAIGKYVLPLLYGLLGAFAFVLRRLSDKIKNLQFTEELKINYNLRINLGALSGLAIGWFLTPDKISLAALSPLALAFLAGYSVELLFTIMDRLVLKDTEK